MDFFTELEKLQLKNPRLGMLQIQSTNSRYTFAVQEAKNCYLVMNAVKNEDCMYGRDLYDNADCVDSDHMYRCTLCYQCLNAKNSYNCNFLQDCDECQDCEYGYDLKACKNCFGCVGLRRKEFYIFNEPYTKEKYFEKIKELKKSPPAEIQKRYEEIQLKVPRVYAYQLNSENCFGDYVDNSQNAFHCFDIRDCQDVGYLHECKKLTDSYDITILEEGTLCYEISSSHILNNSNFCYMCINSSDLEYCEFVNNSKYCFGCVSLNHKEFHILNQPYSKEDYFKKVAEIKDQLRAQNLYGRRFLPSSYPLEDTVATWSRM